MQHKYAILVLHPEWPDDFFCIDLLRLMRTSSGEIREKTQCKINKVMMGKVKQILNKIILKYHFQIVLKSHSVSSLVVKCCVT